MVGSCVIKACVSRHSRPIYGPTVGRHVDRLTADMSVDSRSTCRLTVGRYVGRECRPTGVFITHDPCLQNGFIPLLCEMVVKLSASVINFY